MEILNTIQETFHIWRRDRTIMALSFVPLLVGILLYTFLGQLIFGKALGFIEPVLQSNFSEGLSKTIYYFIIFVLTVALFFIINWTFVAVVSLFTAPLCDMISTRAEQAVSPMGGEKNLGMLKSFWNELKKIFLLCFVGMIVFATGFIPFLVPLSMMISALGVAFGLLDYTYSRHGYHLGEIIGDFRKSFLLYLVSGFIFMFMMAIPIVNLVALPIGVIYFTLIFLKKRGLKNG